MVFIKKLEMRAFKSFGTKTISVQFDQGLTAITGPNGSGKSNIVDAIRFCLGENSPRMLRVPRLTSLIYDGGEGVARPPATRVSISFDNTSRTIPVDSSIVTVTRELRSSGENAYLLNGRRVLKSSLSEILGIALITPEGLNIVPQGMVTRIAEITPEEKRKLIEQVVGVSQFDEKKTEAMKQLNDADMKLQVALARIGEIKNRVDSLEGERNDQLRLKQLEDEIRWLKAVVASKGFASIRRQIVETGRKQNEYGQNLENLQKRSTEILGEIQQIESERSGFISGVVDGAGGRHAELQFALAKVNTEIEKLTHDIPESRKLVTKTEEALPLLTQMRNSRRNDLQSISTRIMELTTQLRTSEKEKKQTERSLTMNQRTRDRLERRVQSTQKRTEKLEERIRKSEELLANLAGGLGLLRNRHELEAGSLRGFEERSASFLKTLEELEGHVKQLANLEKLERNSLDKTTLTASSKAERKQELEEEMARSLSVLKHASETVLKFEFGRSAAEQFRPGDVGIKRLEELSSAGALEGYIGKLAESLEYPQEFEQAVLAIGGKWMNAAVVTDIPHMLRIAETAKRMRVGRIAIMPLSEVRGSKQITSPKLDDAIGTVSSIIKSPVAWEGLVNFLFGDTILVRSPRIAYDIALGGVRSVTQAGDVFEPLTTAVEVGHIQQIESLLDLPDEASFSAIKESVDSLTETIRKRKADLERLGHTGLDLEHEKMNRLVAVERLKTEAFSVGTFLTKYRDVEHSISKKISKQREAQRKLELSIERMNKRISALQSLTDGSRQKMTESEIGPLNEEIVQLETKRSQLTTRLEEGSNTIRDTITELTRIKGSLEHDVQPSVNRLDQQILGTQDELSENRALLEISEPRLEELTAKKKELDHDEAELLKSSKKSRQLLETYDGKLSSVRRREDIIRKSISGVEREKYDAKKTIENLREAEQRYLSELTLYGYNAPVEIFEGSDLILHQLNSEYETLRGGVNLLAERSYQDVFTGYKNLSVRQNQLEEERNHIVRFIEGVDSDKRKIFVESFEKIDKGLRTIFSQIVEGGAAWLELEKPEDIFSSGVSLMTQFPGKVPRESNAVSGGERTVCALSLILAIQLVYPSPVYLFDEIDAHLDAVNTDRIAEILREKGETSQITMLTLKDSVISKANIVYGVYLTGSISQVVKYRPAIEVAVKNG